MYSSYAGVYVKRGTHPEPAGTTRNYLEPPETHPEPNRKLPEPPGTTSGTFKRKPK